MNTPPKLKRFSIQFPTPGRDIPGEAMGEIGDPEIAALVGQATAKFVHLEGMMGLVLAALSGTDFRTAGYMLRSMKSPRGRVDLMLALLEKSPMNRQRTRKWDDLLTEFWRINKRRNAYVHGHWWTSKEDRSMWLAEEDEHGLSLLAARRVEAGELRTFMEDMRLLVRRILQMTTETTPLTPPEPTHEPTDP